MVRLYRSAANYFVMHAPDWLCTWPCTCMCINRCQVADAKQGPADTDWAVSFACVADVIDSAQLTVFTPRSAAQPLT